MQATKYIPHTGLYICALLCVALLPRSHLTLKGMAAAASICRIVFFADRSAPAFQRQPGALHNSRALSIWRGLLCTSLCQVRAYSRFTAPPVLVLSLPYSLSPLLLPQGPRQTLMPSARPALSQ